MNSLSSYTLLGSYNSGADSGISSFSLSLIIILALLASSWRCFHLILSFLILSCSSSSSAQESYFELFNSVCLPYDYPALKLQVAKVQPAVSQDVKFYKVDAKFYLLIKLVDDLVELKYPKGNLCKFLLKDGESKCSLEKAVDVWPLHNLRFSQNKSAFFFIRTGSC